MSILVSILIFGLVILIHEFGHYIVAVKSGILVEEFAIGMGPIVLKKQKGETLYTIRALPLGGFCKMLGEDEDIKSDRAFNSKSVWVRIFVISGGVIMNTILAFIIFFVFNAYNGYIEPVVYSVIEGYPADTIGLEKGDRIYSIDGHKVTTQSEFSLRLSDATKSDIAKGEEPVVDLIYIRNGEKVETEMELKQDIISDRYIIGFNMNRKIGFLADTEGQEFDEQFEEATFVETIKSATNDMFFVVESTFYGLSKMFSSKEGLTDVYGPIGIIGEIGNTYEKSVDTSGFKIAILNMIYILGLISANLAVFNFLPIPALDGGRLVFLIYEAITGNQIAPEKEGTVHIIGFIVLIGFAVVVAFNDILKLF